MQISMVKDHCLSSFQQYRDQNMRGQFKKRVRKQYAYNQYDNIENSGLRFHDGYLRLSGYLSCILRYVKYSM